MFVCWKEKEKGQNALDPFSKGEELIVLVSRKADRDVSVEKLQTGHDGAAARGKERRSEKGPEIAKDGSKPHVALVRTLQLCGRGEDGCEFRDRDQRWRGEFDLLSAVLFDDLGGAEPLVVRHFHVLLVRQSIGNQKRERERDQRGIKLSCRESRTQSDPMTVRKKCVS